MNLFDLILYQPLFNLLVLFYFPFKDFGLAIILLTILIRLLFWPLSQKALKSQKILENLQVKVREIQNKYKEDKEKQAREIMDLYKKEKINPFAGLFPLLVQLPILIALYQVLRKGLIAEEMKNLYSFIPNPGEINPLFLGKINLSQLSVILAFLAALLQFFQTKMTTPHQNKFGGERASKTQMEDKIDRFSRIFQMQTLYFFPIFTFFILLKLPSAISLYWVFSTLFTIIQQYFFFKKS